LVEDSADEIAMLFKILEEIESTLEVSVCRDGLEALDTLMTAVNCAPARLPHFVLLGLNMPRVDDFEALQQPWAIIQHGRMTVAVTQNSSAIPALLDRHCRGCLDISGSQLTESEFRTNPRWPACS